MNDKTRLPRPPLYTEDYLSMGNMLSGDEFKTVILAIMRYTADGTIPDNLPRALNLLFEMHRTRIDAARDKYNQKCVKLASNGAKGGRARAENTKKNAAMFKSPSRKMFLSAARQFTKDGTIEAPAEYSLSKLFDELKAAGWSIQGEPIQTNEEWAAVIRARYGDTDSALPQHFRSKIFEKIFLDGHGLRDQGGVSHAEEAAERLLAMYNDTLHGWEINGKHFSCLDWAAAVEELLAGYSDGIPP